MPPSPFTITYANPHKHSLFTWKEELMCRPTVRRILCRWFQPITQLESWWPICPYDWLMDAPECVCVCVHALVWVTVWRAPKHISPVTIFFCYPQPPTFSERERERGTELMRACEQLNSTWTSLPTWRNNFIQLDNSPPSPSPARSRVLWNESFVI